MRIVVQMLVRNEVDIIQECLAEIAKWGLTEIVILDGASDDGTTEAIRAFDGADIHLVSEPDPEGGFTDNLRNRLMNLTLQHNPDWVLSLDADEIYHTDPRMAIEVADAMGANAIRCAVPQFWITYADLRGGILVEDRQRSIQERRLWYSWGHSGVFIWKAHPEHYYPYPCKRPKRTPEVPGVAWNQWQKYPAVMPICKHYCFRTLEQACKRTAERIARGGRQNFGKYWLDWIIDEREAHLHRFDVDNPLWDMRYNHDAVYRWMGRHTQ
jgi:glycosyltransferase involved in cell wall biosynthesis